MQFTTTIQIVVLESPNERVPGVKVCLYDRDRASSDDLLGSGKTDENGAVTIQYSLDKFTDIEDRPGFKSGLPDLYVVVYSQEGEVITSTRSQAVENKILPMITVKVSREQIVRFGLIPHKPVSTPDENLRETIGQWSKKISSGDPEPPNDLCLTRTILDAMSGVAEPKSKFQKQVADQLWSMVLPPKMLVNVISIKSRSKLQKHWMKLQRWQKKPSMQLTQVDYYRKGNALLFARQMI